MRLDKEMVSLSNTLITNFSWANLSNKLDLHLISIGTERLPPKESMPKVFQRCNFNFFPYFIKF